MKYSALALLLTTTPAFADITPAELFGSWQGMEGDNGIEYTAESETMEGDTLVLANVSLSIEFEVFSATQNVEWIRMVGMDDGSVVVTSSPIASFEFVVTMPGAEAMTTSGTAMLTNLSGHAVGSIDDYVYSSSMDEMSLSQSGNTPGTPMTTEGSLIITALQSSYHIVTTDEGVQITGTTEMENYSSTSDSKSIDDGTSPLFSMSQSMITSINGIKSSFEMRVPAGLGQSESLIPEGLTAGLTMSFESQTMEIRTKSGVFAFDMAVEQGAGETEIVLGENEISYSGTAKDAIFEVTTAEKEGIFEVAVGSLSFDASLPFRVTGEPTDASFGIEFENLIMADPIWALFDPSNEFERGPANLDLSVNANLTLLVDMTDIDALENMTEAPLELHSVTLETLTIDGEGAEVEASGSLDFATLGGEPLPDTGSFSIAANGVLALLDKVGRVPEMDPMAVMGAKGAFGMFATPGEMPDSFTSVIEFIAGGGITINGQRVR